MKHVFISYKHDEDSVFAELLITKIKEAGFEAWIDYDQLQVGKNFHTEIDQAIKDSLALIIIMTPAAKISEYITYEWAFALGVGVKVIPILHKDTERHPRLKMLQSLDFTNSKFFPWSSLINALKVQKQIMEQDDATLKTKKSWLTVGKVLLERKEYEEALRAYNEAISLDDNYTAAYIGKSRTLSKLKRYQEALAASQRLIQLDPNISLAWNNKGNALYNLKRYEDALVACEKAIHLDPDYTHAWDNKGRALYGLKRYEEALAACEKAIYLDPDYAHAWNTKSCALYCLSRYEEALKASEDAIRLDPDYARAWNAKGCALEALRREKEAKKCYEKARQLGYKD